MGVYITSAQQRKRDSLCVRITRIQLDIQSYSIDVYEYAYELLYLIIWKQNHLNV